MISDKTLHLNWINFVSKNNRNADKILIEKIIRALLLLEGLVESDLNFIFKGGTALMLLQESTKRLSIDIDIILPHKIDLKPYFEQFYKNKYFAGYEYQDRGTNFSIEKAHYKFFYQPVFKTSEGEDNILLDILFEKSQYQKIESINIDSSFVKQKGKVLKVPIPSYEDLLADKLTAFAPNTSGIPYAKSGQSQAMEIIKQLYDIGNLFEDIADLNIVHKTFYNFALTELKYRNLPEDPQIICNDIFQTALCISTRGSEGKGNFEDLQDGISKVRAFIFSEIYQIEKATVDSAKAAYLSKLIEFKIDKFERFETAMQIRDWQIEQPFNKRLNKLKKSNPQAFFYWYKTFELQK